MKRITLLVDGEYLIKRSFLSNSNHYTKEFGNMDGLFNFMLSLRTVVNTIKANKVVVCWDGQNGGKLRYNIYNGYKANRKHKEWYNKIQLSDKEIAYEEQKKESLLKNKIRIQQYLEEMFIRQIYNLDIIEADDMIAYYVQNYHKTENITIFTNDRDLCQLIEYDNVNIYLGNKKALINQKNYFLDFKHDYRNLRIIKTFCGDVSDNIKGVSGLAETTFLKNFPKAIKEEVTIDYILEQTSLLIEERIKEKKKPLKILTSILNGLTSDKEELGKELYDLNFRLVNLNEPFLTKEAKHVIKEESEIPLDSDNRGSHNLIKYMKEDGFMSIWNGSVNTFCSPFYATIIKEKEFFKNSKKNNDAE